MLTDPALSLPAHVEQFPARRSTAPRSRGGVFKSFALAISLVTIFAVTEAALRIGWEPPNRRAIRDFNFRNCMMPDPELGHVPRPGALVEYPRFNVSFHANRLGLRGGVHPVARTSGVRRIVVMGDSMAWGHGVAEQLTFAELIEQTTPTTEVINLGVPGYNLRTELAYFERIGAQYRPDLVVLALCQNDVVDHDALARRREEASHCIGVDPQHATSPRTGLSSAKQFLSDHLRVYRAAQEAVNAHKPLARAAVWMGLKDELAGFDGLDENLHSALREYPPTVQHAMELLRADLSRIDAMVRAGGARLLVVLIPAVQAVDARQLELTLAYTAYVPGDFDMDKPYRQIEQFARTCGIDVINPLHDFRQAQAAGERLYLPGDLHLSAAGHLRLAEAIDAFIR